MLLSLAKLKSQYSIKFTPLLGNEIEMKEFDESSPPAVQDFFH